MRLVISPNLTGAVLLGVRKASILLDSVRTLIGCIRVYLMLCRWQVTLPHSYSLNFLPAWAQNWVVAKIYSTSQTPAVAIKATKIYTGIH